MKIVAMIPARLGSKRVPRKNLRLLGGRPLISFVIEAAVNSGVFDKVYVNSEAEIFSGIAKKYGAQFYKRPPKFATDETNNDDFANDFMDHISGDILIQILPTSPLLTISEITDFVGHMVEKSYDTLVSTVSHQIAGIFKNKPINFSPTEPHISSQKMIPVETYATVLMGWKYSTFKHNMQELGFAYHGGAGSTGYFPVSGLTTIDIDNEDDFRLAEVAMNMRLKATFSDPEYYGEAKDDIEVDVPEILKKDGVLVSNFEEENNPLSNIPKLLNKYNDASSWCHRLVNTENNSATLIGQMPGEGNRLHYHPHWNEWWYILEGEWEWMVEGKRIVVTKGDFVFIEKNRLHKITAIGTKIAIRLAVSRADVEHVYPGS
jgi:CMP-N-acetylneuraminic acid synthetase/quercetin dioxygenase-like cupin family protein